MLIMNDRSNTTANRQLSEMLGAAWNVFVTQGGILERPDIHSDGYLISGLWVYSSDRWIEIASEGQLDDSYPIKVCESAIRPIPEPSRINYPPRLELETFPSDCPLHELRSALPLRISTKNGYCRNGVVTVKNTLTVISDLGTEYSFSPSESSPGDILVSAVRL